MNELYDIIIKYEHKLSPSEIQTLEELNDHAAIFYKDVADVYDCITRVRNTERNPSGYSLDDAPIIGLLVRIWKILRETIAYHEADKAEFIAIFDRTLVESAITATYLLKSDSSVLEDYRKCSYKDRLRILRDFKEGSAFFESKAGKRLLKSVTEKMDLEGLTENDFEQQKRNRWKLQGKSFFDIFKTNWDEKFYRYSFGIMSETVHCSWNESMDWCLTKNEDNTFSPFPFYHPADIRYISGTLMFCNEPYKRWLKRIDAHEDWLIGVLDWVESYNHKLFFAFDNMYDE